MLWQASYLVFAPEVLIPDVDPERLREGGDTPGSKTTESGYRGRSQLYLGARAEIFPSSCFGLGVNARWNIWFEESQHDQVFSPQLIEPFTVSGRMRPLTITAYVVLALPNR